jgi:rod shape-determining protein MreC
MLTPIVLILICLAQLSFSVTRSSSNGSVTDSVALEAVGPVGSALNYMGSAVENVWLNYFNLVGLKAENDNLKRIVEQQNGQIVQLLEERVANNRYKELLDFKEKSNYNYIAANVIGWDPGPWTHSFVINSGSSDGVLVDAAVVTDRGVVGRVIETAHHYSKVLLLTDLSSGIDALIQRNRVNGLLIGHGHNPMSLDYIVKDDDVRPGDMVVTSGLDGVFPPGLALGSITVVDKNSLGLFLKAEISPAVTLENLQEVLVVLGRQPSLDWLSLAPDLKILFEKKSSVPR